ncbi:MAG TPA: hypothetical protein VFG89_10880 [Coriobacteriia bacterium]|nr:hypothetical protein [Coriobacteriia bacterium]
MTLRIAFIVAGVAAAFLVLHLLATWAEERGWIYYRKGRGRNWSVGSAAQELQSLLQPSARHTVEEARRTELVADEAGDSEELDDADD